MVRLCCWRWKISCTESAQKRSGKSCRPMDPLLVETLTSLLPSSISANSTRFHAFGVTCFADDLWNSLPCLRFWILRIFFFFVADDIILQVRPTLENFFSNTKNQLYLLQIDAKKVCTYFTLCTLLASVRHFMYI